MKLCIIITLFFYFRISNQLHAHSFIHFVQTYFSQKKLFTISNLQKNIIIRFSWKQSICHYYVSFWHPLGKWCSFWKLHSHVSSLLLFNKNNVIYISSIGVFSSYRELWITFVESFRDSTMPRGWPIYTPVFWSVAIKSSQP